MWALGQTNNADDPPESGAIIDVKATLKFRREIQAELEEWNGYAQQGGDIKNVVARGDAEEIVRAGLTRYAQDEGWAVTGDVQRDVDNLARGLGEEALRSQGIDVSLRFKSLEGAAVNMASAGVTYATGVNPSLARMSVESFSDGKLSEEEMQATCALAGSIAGAAVGQMFGIPAPIGAWVGGIIGGEIGGVVSDIFGLGVEADRAERAQQRRAALAAELEAARQEASLDCSGFRAAYWQAFDATLFSVEEQWQRLECQVGRRFDIRWFDEAPSSQLFSFNRAVTRAELRDGVYRCLYAYGCPYPPTGSQGAGGVERVAKAFAARGFRWPKCTERPFCNVPQWPDIATVRSTLGYAAKARYMARLDDYANGREWPALSARTGVYAPYQPRFMDLDKMTTAIMNDLIMTAGAVRAELDVAGNHRQIATEGLAAEYTPLADRRPIVRDVPTAEARRPIVRDVPTAEARVSYASAREATFAAQRSSKLLNYGALALGTGVLGYAIYKRRR